MKVTSQKTLWEQYGKIALTGVVLFIVAYAGMQYYFNRQIDQRVQASKTYDNLMVLLEEDKTVEAAAEAQELIDRHPNSPYASLASLMLAKLAVEDGDLPSADKHLRFVIKTDKNGPIHEVAKVRLARVLSEQRQFDEALKLLDPAAVPDAYLTLVEEARGDIFLLQDKRDEARVAYQAAVKAAVPGTPIERLQLKQAELGIKEE